MTAALKLRRVHKVDSYKTVIIGISAPSIPVTLMKYHLRMLYLTADQQSSVGHVECLVLASG